jgi:FKBP-type peptidyl-prolyl cis-trans isomerase (trigger factor)
MAETKPNFSEGITTTLECPEPWQRVIKVEITRDEYDKEYTRRLKKARKGHQMRGHRKGHSPLAVVEKEMGTMVRMDAIEALVPRAYMAGVVEHKINPITEPALENLEWEDETAPLTFDLMVEVRPEIETVDFENIPVKKREVEVTDEALTEVLDRLRESKARFEIVEREAAKDDQVTLDLTPAGEDGESRSRPEDRRPATDPGRRKQHARLQRGHGRRQGWRNACGRGAVPRRSPQRSPQGQDHELPL